MPYTGAALAATTIYVRFKPTSPNTNYSGNVTNSGGGATTENVAVTGTSISTCTGYAVAVESSTGVGNPENALIAPDGSEFALDDQGDILTLDLGETLNSGGSLVVRWRESGSGKPEVTVEISDDASTWTAVPGSPIMVNPNTLTDETITLNADTRYIRFTTLDGNNLRIDAVSYTDQPCIPPVQPTPLL